MGEDSMDARYGGDEFAVIIQGDEIETVTARLDRVRCRISVDSQQNDELARGAVRFSFGNENTTDDVSYVLEILPKAVENLRKHDVTFKEAQSVFYDEHAIEFYDDEHSEWADIILILDSFSR